MKPELLEKLNWLAAKHVTSEYRTTTIDEDDARQILTAIQAAPQVVYQHSIDTTGGWQDCSKYDYELFHVDERRTLYTSPPSGGGVVEACILGVGCETYGVCYAMANGDSGKCGKNRGDL